DPGIDFAAAAGARPLIVERAALGAHRTRQMAPCAAIGASLEAQFMRLAVPVELSRQTHTGRQRKLIFAPWVRHVFISAGLRYCRRRSRPTPSPRPLRHP